jgi:protein AaeX
MSRDLAVPDAYIPTILLLFAIGALIAWIVDRMLAMTGLYRVVWHPALFRASLLVCICGLLSLSVYK